ncbi:MAG: DUF177 domain-containing protein [Halanaerobium sp.]|nr:DUF177 domain-containing protein [Halanaerobium sp.]
MKINLRDIRNQPGAIKEYEFTEEFAAIELQGREIIPLEPIAIKVRVTNLQEDYLVEGHLETIISVPCSRCLEQVEIPVTSEILHESPKKGPEAVRDFIDLTDEVYTALILQVPMQPLCTPDCKGLCSICGKNLNEGDCGCDREVVDPRLADLKKFFDK